MKQVNSFTEWAPLEEVIVGDVRGSIFPYYEPFFYGCMPEKFGEQFKLHKKYIRTQIGKIKSGKGLHRKLIELAQEQLDGLANTLTKIGVTVRRPKIATELNLKNEIITPTWKIKSACYYGNPRDVLAIIGDTILDAPMGCRARSFEYLIYKDLCLEYFKNGAKWIACPKPALRDEMFHDEFNPNSKHEFVTKNIEPIFDAATIVKFGKDLVVARDTGCNELGIEWIRRQFPDYIVHVLETEDPRPLHLDTTFIPLCQGKIMVNTDYCKKIPDALKHWEIKPIPEFTPKDDIVYALASPKLAANVLSLDGKRILVEESEKNLMDFLSDWGFEPIPIPFRYHFLFGGGLHCATLDVRRKDHFKSYL